MVELSIVAVVFSLAGALRRERRRRPRPVALDPYLHNLGTLAPVTH